MTDEELKKVYQLYTDCWKLFHKYHGNNTESAWEEVDRITRNMVKQYGDYSSQLIVDTICLLERSCKE